MLTGRSLLGSKLILRLVKTRLVEQWTPWTPWTPWTGQFKSTTEAGEGVWHEKLRGVGYYIEW